jgi:hypothetical protein
MVRLSISQKIYMISRFTLLNMKAEQLSKSILDLDSNIRFAGVMEKSGHLYAGGMREGVEEYLKGRNPELSLAQTAYVVDLRRMFSSELGDLKYIVYAYDKVNIFSLPVRDHVLVFSADNTANIDHLTEKVLQYVKSIESELSLYPPANIINTEKKEILRNLHESGIPEDMIADQLDLDINTVKMLIQELHGS